jgi:hypothetical protein
MLEQMSVCLRVGQVVDGHDIDVFAIALGQSAKSDAANATESVDTNSNCHKKLTSENTRFLARVLRAKYSSEILSRCFTFKLELMPTLTLEPDEVLPTTPAPLVGAAEGLFPMVRRGKAR